MAAFELCTVVESLAQACPHHLAKGERWPRCLEVDSPTQADWIPTFQIRPSCPGGWIHIPLAVLLEAGATPNQKKKSTKATFINEFQEHIP